MIRTCRLFFPVRNNYNVSLLNKRTCQPKQISVEFSFYTEHRKENYFQKKSGKVKSEFSTFKEHEKVEHEKNQEKKSKSSIPSDYVTFKAKKETTDRVNPLENISSEKMNIDFSTFKENLKSKSVLSPVDIENGTPQSVESTPSINDVENDYKFQADRKILTSRYFYGNNRTTNREAIKSLKVLAKTGNRVTSNLKFFTQVFMTSKTPLDLTECCDVFYSYAKLSFANLPVLDLMAKYILEALSKNNEHNPKVILSLLQSVCKLKYRNCELIENLCKHINMVQQLLSPEQITLCLFALSNVNVRSSYVDNFIDTLSKLKNTDFNKTRNFMNYIWASIILGKENSLPLEHLEKVLSKNFIEQLTISGENNLLTKLKLSNISGVASSLKNYKGPLVDNLILSPVLSRSKNDFLGSMRDSLSYIFPKVGFIEALSYVGSGVFIDIECCLDSSCNPVLLKNKEEYNKIGIVLLDHSDMCLESTEMTGVTAFKLAILGSAGYKVVTIPYTEFPFNNTLASKIGYLQNKLKKVSKLASDK